MTHQTSNPATRADAGRARECIAVAANVPEHIGSPIDLQLRRAAWIACRYRLAPTMARLVAELTIGGQP